MSRDLFKPSLEKITRENDNQSNKDIVKLECDPEVPNVCGPDDGEPCSPAWGGACSPDLPPDTCSPDSDDDNNLRLTVPQR